MTVPIKNSNQLLQFGQNLAWAEQDGPGNKSSGGSIQNSINEWYDEGRMFNPNKPSLDCSEACKKELHSDGLGHFTQLCWKKSNQIGCAQKELNHGNGKVTGLWCCNYLPAGNLVNSNNSSVIQKGTVGTYKPNCTSSQNTPANNPSNSQNTPANNPSNSQDTPANINKPYRQRLQIVNKDLSTDNKSTLLSSSSSIMCCSFIICICIVIYFILKYRSKNHSRAFY